MNEPIFMYCLKPCILADVICFAAYAVINSNICMQIVNKYRIKNMNENESLYLVRMELGFADM